MLSPGEPLLLARRFVMPRPFGSAIELPADLRRQLEALARARSTPQALALRCRIVLRAADPDGPTNQAIAAEYNCDRHAVGPWRERFVAHGLAGLQDAPRSGRPRASPPERERRRPGHRQ
jgi:hypothetical protein